MAFSLQSAGSASGLRLANTASQKTQTASFRVALDAARTTQRLQTSLQRRRLSVAAEVAADASTASSDARPNITSGPGEYWVPLVPVETLPKGERRLVKAEAETILLLWYKNEILAIENASPAEGAYSEGLFNARLSQDGCVICPLTDSTFDLKTGQIRDWYPDNPIMRFLTRPLRELTVYPVKILDYQICVNLAGKGDVAREEGDAAELVFARSKRAGDTATDVVADYTKMIVDDTETGFGFTPKNELVNGRGAMAGFFLLIIIELITGKGLLGSTGFLDFLYSASGGGPVPL